MEELILSEINIYPVKSLGGISLTSSEITERGLKFDRRWMLLDYKGDFMTQREYPQMSLLQVSADKNYLKIFQKKNPADFINISFESYDAEAVEVPVWNDICTALSVSKEADKWISDALHVNCKIFFMPDSTKRFVNKKYAKNNEIVSFADAYPFLIIGQSSLDDLNKRLKEPLPMNRFRPNFVFKGGRSFIEDEFYKFKIGGNIFYALKPCGRCAVTTVNQQTGETGKEPLKTLSKFRKIDSKVMFGQNLVGPKEGVINTGDKLEVLEWKEALRFN